MNQTVALQGTSSNALDQFARILREAGFKTDGHRLQKQSGPFTMTYREDRTDQRFTLRFDVCFPDQLENLCVFEIISPKTEFEYRWMVRHVDRFSQLDERHLRIIDSLVHYWPAISVYFRRDTGEPIALDPFGVTLTRMTEIAKVEESIESPTALVLMQRIASWTVMGWQDLLATS